MNGASCSSPVAEVYPLTESRWKDLETLFGPAGACYGCWCQYWRMPRAEWRRAKAPANKAALQRQTRDGIEPGLIGFAPDGSPVGWVSLGPRDAFPGLRNSRFFGETPDARGLWSAVCFYVPARYRAKGVAEAMLAAGVRHARKRKARALEAYPWDLAIKTAAVSSLYVGTLPMFLRAGFAEVSRRVPHRPVVRLELV